VRAALPLLLLAVPLAGCLGSTPASDGGAAPAAPTMSLERPTEDPWNGSLRQVLVNVTASGATEADVLCATGGSVELERDPAGRVLPGAASLEVRVRVDATFTGLQVGYAIDDGRVAWLPTVSNGEATQAIPVRPDQAESSAAGTPLRWRFYHQMNAPPPAEQDCYTGAGAGSWSVAVEALKEP
jgi:hypothetical protein